MGETFSKNDVPGADILILYFFSATDQQASCKAERNLLLLLKISVAGGSISNARGDETLSPPERRPVERMDLGSEARKTAQEILGYLNFSSGAADPRFFANINHLFALVERAADSQAAGQPAWLALGSALRSALAELHGHSDAFRQVDQAEAVLTLVFDHLLPAYRQYHRDLLFHQTDEGLFQPFFIARGCEVVLRQGGPWEQVERIVADAIGQLNDYLGHRPVAVLRTQQKIQPYVHEWVCPIPLYLRGAGVAAGRYHDLIERALAILASTDPMLLLEAMFDPALLDEVAVDPRAYDFDHPVNKRPNYLFGQWDLGKLDNSGRCRRYVLQQISLDAMLERIAERGKLPYEEILYEEAAVLAGTMLMGSGVSGNRPEAHDSSVTLATLVQQIAGYRDAFYEKLLSQLSGPHAERLQDEALVLRQPLGGARQHFNQHLAKRRAEQLQYVNLAQLFARMGYTEAAVRQARMVPVASARMKCDIYCRLTTAQLHIDGGQLAAAAALLEEVEDLLYRAIECGAVVDPWNMLGFGGQYSLFPAPENSVHDYRIDELIELVGEIFAVYVQLQQEAAASGNTALQETASQRLDTLATWWDKFASTEVGSLEGISGRETRESADHVAAALQAWHKAGTAAGDLAFWRDHAEQFRSPKAYALVVDALLEQRDPVAAMALLVQWLSQAEEIPLVEETYSFHDLTLDWMGELWSNAAPAAPQGATAPQDATAPPAGPSQAAAPDRWELTRKFLDYLEANAEEYWQVPQFELAASPGEEGNQEDPEELSDEADSLFSAAYEDMSYRDSTDDGFEGEMLEGGQNTSDFELVLEAERIFARLTFLSTLAQLWKMAAVASAATAAGGADRDQVLAGWLKQASANRKRLVELLASAHRYRILPPRGTQESLVEYDRRRGIKEMLVEQIITTTVETVDAGRLLRVVMTQPPPAELEAWERPIEEVLRSLLHGDVAAVRKNWHGLVDTLSQQSLLYVALARGGNPLRIVASRGLQGMLRRLLGYLPRQGLLRETAQLIETIQEMELSHPVGPGAITEFDQMFKIGCKAIVRCLVMSSQHWNVPRGTAASGRRDAELISYLEQTTEALLRSWLVHSRGVRLSVLETINDKEQWRALKQFVERYGHDLFTQRFMNLGNVRAILHQGVDAYLQSVLEEPDAEEHFRLLTELDGPLPREDAVHWLTVILEAVVENYAEYVDYNSTTTQSDRGEMLYTLLDYLRLRASYDRVAWTLQPVVLAHEVLVRAGRDVAAEIWRSAVAERTAGVASEHLKRFTRLNRKYGMRLPSIAERLGERFIRPLQVDQLRALVQPAMEELRGSAPLPADAAATAAMAEAPPGRLVAFRRLEEGIAQFTQDIAGAGFDLPAWLEALQQEVDRVESQAADDDELPGPELPLAQIYLSREEVRRQVKAMVNG